MASLTQWYSVDYPDLQIEEWADGYGVFQPASGKTHYLSPLGMQLLADLYNARGHSLSGQELCVSLAARLGLVPDPSFVRQLHDTLLRFDELGLVRQRAES